MVTRIEVGGVSLQPAIKEQLELAILASFEDDETQANISSDSFTFILEGGYEILKNHIDAGRIFENLSFRITVEDGDTQQVFDGFVRLWKEHTIRPQRQEIEATVEKKEGLNRFFDRASGTTFQLIEANGGIGDSDYIDVDYTVEEITNFIDLVIIGIQVYSVSRSLVENTYKLQDATANAVAHLTGGVSGSAASAAYAVAQAVAVLAYQAALVAQLIRLARQILEVYVRPKRTGKGARLQTLAERACQYLGFDFNTSISELKNYTYFPRNTRYDELNDDGFIGIPKGPDRGIPNAADAESIVLDFFNMLRDMFNAKIGIADGTVELHKRNSPFWRRQSSYVLPDIAPQEFSYNTSEATAINSISFAYDSFDEFTIKDNKDVSTIAYLQNEGENNIEGRDAVELSLALGSRKDSLTPLELVVSAYLTSVDTAVRILSLGAVDPGFSDRFSDKIGILKVTTNNWQVPKVLYLDDKGKMPPDHREKLSSRHLYNNYHAEKSWVTNAEQRQRLRYSSVEVPFSLADFQKITENSYIRDSQGRPGKVISIEWNINRDTATLDYYIEQQYTDRLIETITHPR